MKTHDDVATPVAAPQLDEEWLSEWLRQEHLDPERLRAARERFEQSRFRSVALDDFLRDDVMDSLAHFLTSDAKRVEKHMLYGSAEEGAADFGFVTKEKWLDAEPRRRLSRFGLMRGLPSEAPPSALLMALRLRDDLGCRLTPQMMTFLRLHLALSNPRFTRVWETVTGLPLGLADIRQVNIMRRGDFIGPHDDFYANRRLTVLLYVAPGWTEDLGGSLTFVAPDGSSESIPVRHNRLVLFEVSKTIKHQVEPIEEAAGDRQRVMLGGSVNNA